LHRASSDASTAVNAEVFIADSFVTVHGKCAYWAYVHACSAANAGIFIDLDSHFDLLYGFFHFLKLGAYVK